jgi:hypothetical protein
VQTTLQLGWIDDWVTVYISGKLIVARLNTEPTTVKTQHRKESRYFFGKSLITNRPKK